MQDKNNTIKPRQSAKPKTVKYSELSQKTRDALREQAKQD